MAYSESLAERVRFVLRGRRQVSERKLFGGLGFFLKGNMLVGVWRQALIARLGPEATEAALQEPDVVPFDVTGKPMKGWVMVEPDGLESDAQLRVWIERSEAFVGSLPAK